MGNNKKDNEKNKKQTSSKTSKSKTNNNDEKIAKKQTKPKTSKSKANNTKIDKKQRELSALKELVSNPKLTETLNENCKKKNDYLTFFQTRWKLILLIVIIISILLGIIYLTSPKIDLIGKKKVILDYNQTYEELGSTGKYLGKDLTNKIKISGSVNTKKVGTYKIKYKLKVSFWNIEKVRTVKVVDKKEPIITLEGDKEFSLCPNEEYQESGYQALDEYDGDLTKKVQVIEKDNQVIYKVKDLSGNETIEIRKINKKDETKPTITLKASSTIYHKLNTAFTEPGYEAFDNCDKDLTKNVVVTGKVDVNKEGKYTLTYTVKDSSQNETKVERIVQVYKKIDIDTGITKKGTIYLTFDDGPNKTTTNQILDILKEENVKATFFVTNSGPDSLIKREYDEGHTIGLHTASHNYQYIYSSMDNYFNDLKQVSDRVKRITGQESMIIRFPGGSNNTVSKKYSEGLMTALTNEVLNRGYRYYDWNIDASDAWQCAKNSVSDKKICVYNNVVNNLSKNKANIVLMHDIKPHTVNALKDIIHYGKENGYTFEALNMDTAMIRFKVSD